MLACIRCGACLNVCPVYRKCGGGAYGTVYSGPMGAVLAPLLAASSTRGAPPRLDPLRRLHRGLPGEDPAARAAPRAAATTSSRPGSRPWWERSAFTLWSFAWSRRLGYRVTTRLARLGQPLAGRAGPGRVWASGAGRGSGGRGGAATGPDAHARPGPASPPSGCPSRASRVEIR